MLKQLRAPRGTQTVPNLLWTRGAGRWTAIELSASARLRLAAPNDLSAASGNAKCNNLSKQSATGQNLSRAPRFYPPTLRIRKTYLKIYFADF